MVEWVLDDHLRAVWIGPRAEELFGARRAILVKNWVHLVTPGSVARAIYDSGRAIWFREAVASEAECWTHEGVVLVRWYMEPVTVNGLFVGFSGITRPLKLLRRIGPGAIELPLFLRGDR